MTMSTPKNMVPITMNIRDMRKNTTTMIINA
jgi:hypothetical protein